MVDAPERLQVRRELAVRDATLHKSDLNAGIRIVRSLSFLLPPRLGRNSTSTFRPCEYALITIAENLVVLPDGRGGDRFSTAARE